MKLKLFIALFFTFHIVSAQFNQDAPWIPESNVSKKKTASFTEIQTAFYEYWKTHDKKKKGSGFKPFKRFEYIWEKEVDGEGNLPTVQDKWAAWEIKKSQERNSPNETFSDLSNWLPIGPYTHTNTGSWSNGQARTNVIAVDPNNSSTWYVGTPAGGLWKSTNSGGAWSPLTDNLPQIGVSGIAIDYSNSNIIYIATGDDDAGDTSSAGVFKSIDGGLTWNQTGLNPNNTPLSMNDIYIHPTNSNILWVATSGGVYKSTNAGTTWTLTLAGNIKDIKIKPGSPDIVYAVTTNQFFKSTDTGDSFTQITFGVPTGGGRMVIDVTPANPNYVYLLSVKADYTKQGVYRSTNSGTTFTTRNTTTDVLESTQAWYDLALGVSTTNAEEVFVGCLNVWRSTNGGTAFTKLNNWSTTGGAAYTHADIHQIRSFNGAIFVCSDGGIYSSVNDGTNFTNRTGGIQASQFYKVAVSPNDVNKMMGGLQDNGGHAYNNGNGNWLNYYGADGMDTAINPTNDNKYYGFIQYGGTLYKTTNAGSSGSGEVNAPATAAEGNWVTPLAINNTGQVFAGYDSLYRLNAAETGWTKLADLGANADQIEIAPSNNSIIYIAVGTVLKKSINAGTSVTDAFTFGGSIKGIGIHTTDPNIVWVTTSSGVWKSINGGTSFTNITGNLPITNKYIFFNDIVHQGGHVQNPVYLATSIGVYRTVDGGNWELFSMNLPTTIVTDLEINIANNSITAATYGRGVWRSALPTCTTVTSTQEINVDNTGYQEKSAINVCTGQSILLKPTVTTGANPTYTWSGPNGFSYTGQIATLNNITASQFGEYSVIVTTTGTCGDTEYKFSVTGEIALQPTSSDVWICSNNSTILTANGSADYRWYAAPSGGPELTNGNTYTTPVLNSNTTYYVSGTSMPIATESIGSPSIASALDYTGNQTMYFDAADDFTLNSCTMYAMSAGNRTITVTNSSGNVVASIVVNIPAGQSVVNLNLNIPKGLNNQIAITSTLVSIRRNNSGVSYPYTSPSGSVSITNSSAGGDYYYFFYDWNITTAGGHCESVRTPVTVKIETNASLTNSTEANINGAGFNTFSSGSVITLDNGQSLGLRLPSTNFNGTWLWTAPNGTTYATETVNFPSVVDNDTNVEGVWTLQAVYSVNCGGAATQSINFTVVINTLSRNEFNSFKKLIVYPNPSNGNVFISSSDDLSSAKFSVIDLSGRRFSIESNQVSNTNFRINISALSVGSYFLIIENATQKSQIQIIKK